MLWSTETNEIVNDNADVNYNSFIFSEQLIQNVDSHLINYFNGFGIESSENPEVSIIIPVHNNIQITIQLLNRIRLNTETISFEVIVVDDASTDSTQLVLRKIRGIRILSAPTNLGYLQATNFGIQHARGKYLALLNNDTLPENGWLTSLHRAISRDSRVAICGSMLIDSNGKILEAGSQIFNDRTIWNLGRGFDRLDPMFLFNREVDYCSAAAILVDADFIRTIGGYDSRFAPAYFEDTDLCLQAWQTGRKVIYVHDAVVYHLEGASHGTDVNSGIKKFQNTNSIKFWEKWSGDFKSEWTLRFQQRLEHRRDSKGIVIFFDEGISDPSVASGARRAFNVIKSIQESGYHVVVIPITPLVTHEILNRYRSLGIEVYPTYQSAISNLNYRRNRLKAIWMSRVTVADKHWHAVTEDFGSLPIIFDTVDLHFLRDERSRQNSLNKKSIYFDNDLKDRELAYIRNSNSVVLVSDAEKEILHSLGEKSRPYVLFDSFKLQPMVYAPIEESNILFIGNFAHHPNSDGLIWFIDSVLPILKARIKNSFKVNVVGSGATPELIKKMANSNVTYHGWQESIDDFYARASLSIAPLKFGSGIKGKIIESYSYGVPVVSTTIGLEGTGLKHLSAVYCADDPESFADGINLLCSNEAIRNEMALNGSEHINKNYSEEKFFEKVQLILTKTIEQSN
jgi:GT2 family glycosyltransferase